MEFALAIIVALSIAAIIAMVAVIVGAGIVILISLAMIWTARLRRARP